MPSTTPYQSVYGIADNAARTGAHTHLGRVVTPLVYLTLAMFYASYVYEGSVASILTAAKWLPLLALFATLMLSAMQRPRYLPAGVLSIFLAGLVIAASASTLFGPFSDSGLLVLISLIVALSTAALLARRIQLRGAEDHFYEIVGNVGRVVILLSFIMAVAGISLGRGARFSGWTDNPNSLGLLLAPTLVILVARVLERPRGWKTQYLPFLIAGLYVLVLTGSRAAIGWVAISFIGLWLGRRGVGAVAIGFVALWLLLFGFEGTSTDLVGQLSAWIGRDEYALNIDLLGGRSEIWAFGLEQFGRAPLLGFGIGSSEPLIQQSAWQFALHQGMHFHSSYVTALVETGLLGAFALVLVLAIAVLRGLYFTSMLPKSPRREWLRLALPWFLIVGALFHATVETWLLSAGNANMLLFWVIIALNFSRPSRLPSKFREPKSILRS